MLNLFKNQIPPIVAARNPYAYPPGDDITFDDIRKDGLNIKSWPDTRQGWELANVAADDPLDATNLVAATRLIAMSLHQTYRHNIVERRPAIWNDFRALLADCPPSSVVEEPTSMHARWTFQYGLSSALNKPRYYVEVSESLPKGIQKAVISASKRAAGYSYGQIISSQTKRFVGYSDGQTISNHAERPKTHIKTARAKTKLARLFAANVHSAELKYGPEVEIGAQSIGVSEHVNRDGNTHAGALLESLITTRMDNGVRRDIDGLLSNLGGRDITRRAIHAALMGEVVSVVDDTQKLQAVVRLLRQRHVVPVLTKFSFTPLSVDYQ